MLSLVVTSGVLISRWWSQWRAPSPLIRTIAVEGAQRLSVAEIRRLLPFREGDRLFGVSLTDAAQRLSDQSWIAEATLYRVLPDTVVVRVQERQPSAMVRDAAGGWYVDRDGVVLGPQNERPGPEMFVVDGVSVAQLRAGAWSERRRLQQALELLDLLRGDGVDAAVVTMRQEDEAVAAFGAWRLHFRAGHYEEQWRHFWQVAERIPADPKRAGQPRDIDLRFANSVVVKM